MSTAFVCEVVEEILILQYMFYCDTLKQFVYNV